MTPKRQVAVMIGVFSALGIGVSLGIIAAGGGFSGGDIFNPPTDSDIYVVGSQVEDNSRFEYTLTSVGQSSALVDAEANITFSRQGDSWRTSFNIVNGTGTSSNFDIILSRQLINQGQINPEVRSFFEPVESSILSIRDMNIIGREKYLIVGAPWDTILYSSSTTTARITAQESVETPAGTFDAFLLSYKLGEETSRIWVVRDLPLPVKAEVYDPSDELVYKYELVNLSRQAS